MFDGRLQKGQGVGMIASIPLAHAYELWRQAYDNLEQLASGVGLKRREIPDRVQDHHGPILRTAVQLLRCMHPLRKIEHTDLSEQPQESIPCGCHPADLSFPGKHLRTVFIHGRLFLGISEGIVGRWKLLHVSSVQPSTLLSLGEVAEVFGKSNRVDLGEERLDDMVSCFAGCGCGEHLNERVREDLQPANRTYLLSFQQALEEIALFIASLGQLLMACHNDGLLCAHIFKGRSLAS
jgi:hypothetical protein